MDEPVTYCRRWNNTRSKPIEPLTSAQAEAMDRDQQPYTLVLGDPRAPRCYVEVAWENGHVGVWFLEDGRRTVHYIFNRVDDERMFLKSITMWHYDDGAGRTLEDASFIEKFMYTPEGNVRRRLTDVRAKKVTEEHFSDVPLDINWEPVPRFGDYRSITRLDRESA